MDVELRKIKAFAVLFVLAFACYAADVPDPNAPAASEAGLSAESPETLPAKASSEASSSSGRVEAELAREYYKDCVQNLKWALGIIIALVAGFVGYAIFKSRREYREALTDVKEALRDA